MIVDGKPQKVSPGVAACIAPDVKHAWKPAGTEPLLAIQFYAPAGAEQRFKTLAEKDAAAPTLGAASAAPPASASPAASTSPAASPPTGSATPSK
jgi:hypothetical protein